MKSSTPLASVSVSHPAFQPMHRQTRHSANFFMVLITGVSFVLALAGSLLVLVSGLAIGLGKLVRQRPSALGRQGNPNENIRSLYQGEMNQRIA